MTTLGKISVRKFKPKTVKKGRETTQRKKDLKEAFVKQNKNLGELQNKCKGKKLSISVTFYLNENTPDKTSYKKDLDNLLKILMDVIKEEMDDNDKKIGLGIVVKNMDEEIFEIICHKEFVTNDDDEGIDLVISKWEKQKNLNPSKVMTTKKAIKILDWLIEKETALADGFVDVKKAWNQDFDCARDLKKSFPDRY